MNISEQRVLVGPSELAKRFNVCTATVYRWVATERVPYLRLSPRAYRFDPEAVERAFVEEKEVPPHE